MGIDWNLVASLGIPLIAAILGAWATRRFERQVRLVTYYGHVAALRAKVPAGGEFWVHTHNVVVRNNGGLTAHNVRLGHISLPDFNVNPEVQYQVVDLPGAGKELVFPTLVPAEQLTVSYLYPPPMTYAQINSYVKSDEGMAKVVTVLLQQQYPRSVTILAGVLMLAGALTVLYLAAVVLRAVL
jgi:hypothetical protein